MRELTEEEIGFVRDRLYFVCASCNNEVGNAEVVVPFENIDFLANEGGDRDIEELDKDQYKAYGAVIIGIIGDEGEDLHFLYKGKCPRCGSFNITFRFV
ncbi:MAG: hypothetical protein V3T58_08225 [Candidatus Hydrothermarchaeales archaeon]